MLTSFKKCVHLRLHRVNLPHLFGVLMRWLLLLIDGSFRKLLTWTRWLDILDLDKLLIPKRPRSLLLTCSLRNHISGKCLNGLEQYRNRKVLLLRHRKHRTATVKRSIYSISFQRVTNEAGYHISRECVRKSDLNSRKPLNIFSGKNFIHIIANFIIPFPSVLYICFT